MYVILSIDINFRGKCLLLELFIREFFGLSVVVGNVWYV